MHRLRSFFVATILALASPGFAADNQQPNTAADQQTAGSGQQLKKKSTGVAEKAQRSSGRSTIIPGAHPSRPPVTTPHPGASTYTPRPGASPQTAGSGQQLKKKSTGAAEKAKKLVGRPHVVPDSKPSLPPVTGPNRSSRRPVARPDAPPPSSQDKEKANETLLKKSSKGVAKKAKVTDRPGISGQRGPGASGQLTGVDQQPAIQEDVEAARELDAANKTRLRDGKVDRLGDTSRFDPFNPDSQAFPGTGGLGGPKPDEAERERSRHWVINGAPDRRGHHAPAGIGWATHMWERGPDPANSEPQSIAWGRYDGGIETTQKFRTSDGYAIRRDRTADDGSGSSTTIEYHRGSDGAQTDTYLEARDEQGRVTLEMFAWETGKWVATSYDYDKTGRRYVAGTESGGRDKPDPEKDPAPDGTSGNYPNPLPWWHSRSMWSLSQISPYELLRDPLQDRDDQRGDRRGEGATTSSGGSSIGSKLGWITDPVPFDNWPGGGGGGYDDPGPGGDPNPAEPPEPPAPPGP